MSTRGGTDGGERPPENGRPEGVSGLPPEWGTVVIPDDPAELAEEAEELRRHLRRSSRRSGWRRRLGLAERPGEPSVGLPLMIMAIAIVATLTSLFVVTWPRQQVPAPLGSRPVQAVMDVILTDAGGAGVRLRDVVPAVVLFVDGCSCALLLAETAIAAAPTVTVVPVGHAIPLAATGPPGASARIRPLADPADRLRTILALPPPTDRASVVLISRTGQVTKLVPAARTLDDFRADLERLA